MEITRAWAVGARSKKLIEKAGLPPPFLHLKRISNSADPDHNAVLHVPHDFASLGVHHVSGYHIVAQTALNAKADCIFESVDFVDVLHITIIYHYFIDVSHSINSFPLLYLYYSTLLEVCQGVLGRFFNLPIHPRSPTQTLP